MKNKRIEILQKVANGELTPKQADKQLLVLSIVSKRFKVDPNKVIKTEPRMIKDSGFNLFG